MECNKCKTNDEPVMITVPYAHLEAKDIRYQTMVKRFVIAVVIMAFMMLAEAGVFVWLWNQYDYSDTTVEAEQDGEGINIAVGTIGGDFNGAESKDSRK